MRGTSSSTRNPLSVRWVVRVPPSSSAALAHAGETVAAAVAGGSWPGAVGRRGIPGRREVLDREADGRRLVSEVRARPAAGRACLAMLVRASCDDSGTARGEPAYRARVGSTRDGELGTGCPGPAGTVPPARPGASGPGSSSSRSIPIARRASSRPVLPSWWARSMAWGKARAPADSRPRASGRPRAAASARTASARAHRASPGRGAAVRTGRACRRAWAAWLSFSSASSRWACLFASASRNARYSIP